MGLRRELSTSRSVEIGKNRRNMEVPHAPPGMVDHPGPNFEKLDFADGGRDRHADRFERIAAGTFPLAADQQAFSVFFDHCIVEGFEVLGDVRPLKAMARATRRR